MISPDLGDVSNKSRSALLSGRIRHSKLLAEIAKHPTHQTEHTADDKLKT